MFSSFGSFLQFCDKAACKSRYLKKIRVRVYTVTDENREGFAQSVKGVSEKLNTEDWGAELR